MADGKRIRYFWDSENQQIIEIHGGTVAGDNILGLDCVDARFYTDEKERYGKYMNHGWVSIPKEKLNPQFLITLHLMGVD